jgi:hypothetical protein
MYNPSLLPVAGCDDLTLNVLQFRTLWQETLRIIDGMRATPEMPATLKISLDSLRFHTGTVLAAINQFLRSGGATTDDAFEVPSVENSIPLFQQELLRTKAHWGAWKTGETASYGPVQPDIEAEQRALLEATKPQTIPEALVFLAGGALIIGVLMLTKK